ncbi:H-NS family nucleoid-associated regulatory protein [Paraburkholderia sp.]|uniref:H-NS family nucleoid-associated regulatory protein n=1 Tax=Paraburkholderia sp. TaxID=1926495 RepID=UPI003D6DB3F6
MPTLESLQAKIQKLQTQAEALIAKQSSTVIEKIRDLMSKHGLTTADIEAYVGGKKRGPKAAASSVVVSKTSVAKYQDPKTGATWSGHGRAPGWIANAKDRSKFLIGDGADAVVAATTSTVGKAKTVVKKASTAVRATAQYGQPKGPQPAKYRDPKSGATWSGRGPAPAWLAGTKDRTRFLIEGAAAAAPGAETSKPKTVTRKAVAKKAPVDKKVAAGKKATVAASPAASKKVAAKKVAATPAKRPVVKKVAAKKAVAVNAVAANAANSTVAPEASLELSA